MNATPIAGISRRIVLTAAPAGLLAACGDRMPTTLSTTPKIDLAGLDRAVTAIAGRARPAALGVGLMNLESGQTYLFNGQRRFPMQSVFKALLGAAALAEADAGRLKLDERVTLTESDLSPQHSPIALTWPGRADYAWSELLAAAVTESDNTAADVLMKRIGGPGAVTAWLQAHRLKDLRVDRYERELQLEMYAMPSFRPAWRTDEAYDAARQAVPPERRLAATRAYMSDPRDTATPAAMILFLQSLDRGDLISAGSTRRIIGLMSQTARAGQRIRAGLPVSAFLAHKPGTSGVDQGLSAATNDTGIFTLADKRSYALAVFLSGSTLDGAGRDAIIADVTRATVKAVG